MAQGSNATLPELLLERSRTSRTSTSEIGFLDNNGAITSTWTYSQLFTNAQLQAQRLVSAGLQPNGSSIVITCFDNHMDHILTFWSCCLAGIPICPIPALHPDRSRQKLFFEHLQSLFKRPILIADDATIQAVLQLIPDLQAISVADLRSIPISDAAPVQVFPSRCPRADDIVCLMLTSGSTGNAKAAALRHSNLLSCIRGKIKHHQTTAHSRFLNWIAFDHVACVSEIHLQALLADASQYHVSPSAIIRNPRNLLDWCSRLRISYTFSPNFLLASICRDVISNPYAPGTLDMSCLQVLISGGEAVPLKTAMTVADLLEQFGAPRNALRAGFGMTETCAGCIYDTRDIPRGASDVAPKYLSLGNCCEGTSMRVVNATTAAICQPYQEGQLQVKGPTVFREYYNNTEATASSFDDGWFITGDLAQLDKEGNLYLVGRDKDCININGVKHPSVDVELYLEDLVIDGLTKSFVYVCPIRLPNADTETYGVFYQHQILVEKELGQAEINSILSTNQAIKAGCVVFCSRAPHVILPLPRQSFVKTALGKISRSAFAKSYLEGQYKIFEELSTPSVLSNGSHQAEHMPSNAAEKMVIECVANIFDMDPNSLTRSDSLFDIGASSMHLIQLKHQLQLRFSIDDIPTIEILQRPEIGQLSDYLARFAKVPEEKDTCEAQYDPLVCLNRNGSKPPLFLVHPGVGEILVFINLARVLADDRPVYALRARGFDVGQVPFTSFNEMTECYVNAIQNCYSSGPYFIAGYSFGGIVAFEMGKKLQQNGKRVAWVGVLNVPPHIQFRMKELVWAEVLVNLCMFLALIPVEEFQPYMSRLLTKFPEIASYDAEPPSSPKILKWFLEQCDQERWSALRLKLEDFHRWLTVAYKTSCTGRIFEPQSCVRGALLTVFCAIPLPSMGTREEFKENRLSKWSEFSDGDLEMIDVDGEHYTMLSEEHVSSFAQKMRGALSRAERLASLAGSQDSLPSLRLKQNFDEVPIIDFSLAETNPTMYFEQLRFALEDVGFGVFTNVPGFEKGMQEELFTLAEGLFSKPREWKEELRTDNSYSLRGYFRADDIVGSHKAYAEAYRFGADVPAPKPSAGGSEVPFWLRLHEGPNQWPAESDLPTFRAKMENLFEKYRALNVTLNSHICQLLDIPTAILEEYYPEKTEFNAALWHYFPLTPEMEREAQDGFVQGMHEHRDPSTFVTCLIQSGPGLQAQNHQGKWVDIPMVEGSVVCNIGAQLMRLTGGRLVATLHRVNTLKIRKDRYTIPYVLSTKLDKSVTPLPQFNHLGMAKLHVAPNPRIQRLMEIEDSLIRSGFARLSLFPAAAKKLYPAEFEEGQRLGIL